MCVIRLTNKNFSCIHVAETLDSTDFRGIYMFCIGDSNSKFLLFTKTN
jgi:hypothetical protein